MYSRGMAATGTDDLEPRIRANLSVRFNLSEEDGRRIGPELRPGMVLDVSKTGLRLRTDPLPPEIVERLKKPGHGLRSETIFTLKGSDTHLTGIVRWAKPGDGGTCILGIEYGATDRERGAQLARKLEVADLRVKGGKVAVAMSIAALLVGGVVHWHGEVQAGHSAETSKKELDGDLLSLKGVERRISELQTLSKNRKLNDAEEKELAKLERDRANLKSDIGKRSSVLADTMGSTKADVTVHLRTGRKLYDEGNTEQALVEYKKALELDPTQPEPYLKIGKIKEFNGELDEAVASYEKFLKLDPGSPDASDVKARLAKLRSGDTAAK